MRCALFGDLRSPHQPACARTQATDAIYGVMLSPVQRGFSTVVAMSRHGRFGYSIPGSQIAATRFIAKHGAKRKWWLPDEGQNGAKKAFQWGSAGIISCNPKGDGRVAARQAAMMLKRQLPGREVE